MPINGTPTYRNNHAEFLEELFDLIRSVEQGRNFDQQVHNDGIGVPTLGYGYAMVVKGQGDQWARKDTLNSDLRDIGITLSRAANAALDDIIDALNDGDQDEAVELITNDLAPAVPTISQADGRVLFNADSKRAQADVKDRLNNNALYNSLVDTREMLALVSLAYNGPGTIGPSLQAALKLPDSARGRAEAWYQIRYQTNPAPKAGQKDVRNGIARRRYVESQVFGLYDAGTVTANSARAVYQMYTAHRDVILQYERDRSANIASANTIDFSRIEVIDRVDTLQQSLNSAHQRLLATYAPGRTDIDVLDVLVHDDSDTAEQTPLTATARNGFQLNTGTQGAYLLDGRGGKDTLIGGSKADVLVGGRGNDTLKGGAGKDRYVFRSGDGTDVIDDADHDGVIVINGVQLSGKNAQALGYNPNGAVRALWVLGSYMLVLLDGDLDNGTLLIQGGDIAAGDGIIVKNFSANRGDLGLKLRMPASGNDKIRTLFGPALAEAFGAELLEGVDGAAPGSVFGSLGRLINERGGLTSGTDGRAGDQGFFERLNSLLLPFIPPQTPTPPTDPNFSSSTNFSVSLEDLGPIALLAPSPTPTPTPVREPTLADLAKGLVSSFLVAQLRKELPQLELNGTVGGAVAEGVNTVINRIALNLVTNPSNLLAGVNPGLVYAAVGGYIGVRLGTKAVNHLFGDNSGAQKGAQIGTQFALTNVAIALLTNPAVFTNPVAIVIVAAAVIIDTLLGGAIGSLFGGTPSSRADLAFDASRDRFSVTRVTSKHGGSKQAARSLAGTVASVLNGVVAASGADLVNGHEVRLGAYGTRGKNFVYRDTSLSGDPITLKSRDASDILDHGSRTALGDLALRLVGGDVFVKRALVATLADAGGEFNINVLTGNLQAARDFALYRDNTRIIDALIAEAPGSAFAVGWLITLVRAVELGLYKRAVTDWVGGWNAFLDQTRDGKLDGMALSPANVILEIDSETRGRVMTFIDGTGEVVGSRRDTIDDLSKDLISGTSEADTIIVNGDRIASIAGLTINETTFSGGEYTIDTVARIDGGAGNDTIVGGDLGNDLIGGEGNDTLVGGKLDDWLFGEDGDDRLFAGW